MQAVFDYLRAHAVDQPESATPVEAAAQAVFDYLSAHGNR